MKFNELTLSSHRRKGRAGRGIAAGQGKTAGRGTKGQGSRAGSKRRPGFEGGQNPMMQRLPKLRGFKSQRPKAELVYLRDLNKVKGTVDNFSVFDAGITSSPYVTVKLVGTGTVTTKHSVALQAATQTAIAAVEKAGGSFKVTERIARPAKKDNKKA
jgi:large subunit ribosomal protein L15